MLNNTRDNKELEDDEVLDKIIFLQMELKEKEELLQACEDLNQTIIIMERKINNEQEDTRDLKLAPKRIEPETLRRSTLPGSKPIPLGQPKWVDTREILINVSIYFP